jgi:hypothetical protein
MLRIASFAIVVAGLGLTGLYLFPDVQTVTLPEKIVEVDKVEIKSDLAVREEAAQNEAMSSIEEKAKAAYEAARTQALKEIELDVISTYRKEVEAKEAELEKDLSL